MYAGQSENSKPLTLTDFRNMRAAGEKFACLTAYDASFAALEDHAGVDLILVGDSLGMVLHGHESTVPVTVDDIIYHCKSVARGISRSFLMADMPFMSYATRDRALDSATRLMQEGGAKMIKLEGGEIEADIVDYLTARGIPVCGHIGLQPQLIHKLGGFRVQGREAETADAMIKDALALQEAGADMLLVECVPSELGRRVTEAVNVPVIGIGAGPDTDAQILVVYDILDITQGRKPRFTKNYMAEAGGIEAAIAAYVREVKAGTYPAPDHCF